MTREELEFDELSLFFGEDYITKNGIRIVAPKIGEILKCGEKEFYAALNPFVANPTVYRLPLWQAGIDWCKISDFDLFCMLYKTVDSKVAKLFLPDIDIPKYEIRQLNSEDEDPKIILFDGDSSIIDDDAYLEISQYLRTVFGIFPKTEKARGKSTKESIIQEELEKAQLEEKEGKVYHSTLLPLVSACVNHPGFKYKTQELKDVGIYEFMNSVQRLQIYETSTALLKGAYSGFMDTSKINKEEFNFMRDLK